MIYPNLRAELARKGWSIKQLADLIKMPATTLNNKLYGKSELNFSEAQRIKDALGVNIPLEVLFAKKGEVA